MRIEIGIENVPAVYSSDNQHGIAPSAQEAYDDAILYEAE